MKKDVKREKQPSPDLPAKKQCVRKQGASPVTLTPLLIVPMPPVPPGGGGAASPVEASGGGMYPEGAGSQEEEGVVIKREIDDDDYNDIDTNAADDPESENENVDEKETGDAVSKFCANYPQDRDPLDRDPPDRYTPGQRPLLDRDPPPPLRTESQTGVKTLPCCNFVAGGKYM